MKITNFFFCLFTLCCNVTMASANSIAVSTTVDSNLIKKIDSLADVVDKLQKISMEGQEIICIREATELKSGEWIVIFFLPVVVLVFACILMYVLRKSPDFKFTNMITIDGTGKDKNQLQSTSRFIAILTGVAAIFIGTTLVMYHGYLMVFNCSGSMQIDGLWKVLAGLGIGVIPYGINVWNKNVKEEAATGTTSET